MDGIFVCVRFLVLTATPLTLSVFYSALFERKLPVAAHLACLIGISTGMSLWLLQLPAFVVPQRIFIILLADLLILFLYKSNFLMGMCVALIHFVIGAAMETVFLPAVLTLFQIPYMQMHEENFLFSTLSYLVPTIGLVLSCLWLLRILRSWESHLVLPFWEQMILLLFAAFTIFLLYFAGVMIHMDNELVPMLSILGGVLLFMNIALLLLFSRLSAASCMKQETLVLQGQIRYSTLHLQAATESYEAQRTLTHDFDNRLLAIEQLLQYGKQDEALSYVREVRASVAQTDVAVSTNNPLADAVLNQKYRRALELGIGMQFLVSDLSAFPLEGDELVTVLSNLLDNALEACQKIRSDGSTHQVLSIRVKLLLEESLATISVKNTSAPVCVDEDGEVETTKKVRNLHGFGLRTCKKILKRSGFDFVVHYQNGWFQFTAIKAL